MSISRPYFRILRFNDDGHSPNDFIYHRAYASDRYLLVRAFKMIENDLIRVFEFIEPSERNQMAYSHRLYELFLRASTEFETNSKQILMANGYSPSGRNWNIEDYYKVNQAMQLSQYEVKLNIWYPEPKTIKPFVDWQSGSTLNWYSNYNQVKHHRSENFPMASLTNVIEAISALASILFAQFQYEIFDPYNNSYGYSKDDDGFIHADHSLFSIRPYGAWSEPDKYDQSCDSIPDEISSFQKFIFSSH